MIDRERIKQRIPETGRAYDVIVVGAGVAGFGAAVASAMNGAKTLLLESKAILGGVAATSLWMPMNRILLRGKNRDGAPDQFLQQLKSHGPEAWRPGKQTLLEGDNISAQPEYLNLAMFETLEKFGCDYRLNSTVVGAEVVNKNLTQIRVMTKHGFDTFEAKCFIDCSGDGDLSYYAGAETEEGNAEGMTMPATLGFSLANVDVDRLMVWYDKHSKDYDARMKKIIQQAEADGYAVCNWYSFDQTTIPHVISVNNGGWNQAGKIHAEQAADSTFMQRVNLQVAIDFVEIARKYQIPGLENCYLDRVGATISIRETRRVMGDYVLTIEDVQQNTIFDHPVARRYGNYDQGGLDEFKDGPLAMYNGHQIPLESLYVKGLNNLLVAGRCGSYTHVSLPAGKSMGNMIVIGQSAGIVAALAAKANKAPREISYEEIKKAMLAMNIEVGGDNW